MNINNLRMFWDRKCLITKHLVQDSITKNNYECDKDQTWCIYSAKNIMTSIGNMEIHIPHENIFASIDNLNFLNENFLSLLNFASIIKNNIFNNIECCISYFENLDLICGPLYILCSNDARISINKKLLNNIQIEFMYIKNLKNIFIIPDPIFLGVSPNQIDDHGMMKFGMGLIADHVCKLQ